MSRSRVAFIGIGAMGAPMFERVLVSGFEGVAWDIDKAACDKFDGRARIAASASDAARNADIVIGCLPSIAAYEALVDGSDSIAVPDCFKLFINVGTIGPQAVRHIAEKLLPLGIETLDAPITGGVPRAVTGRLTTIVSGPTLAKEFATPILSSYSENIFDMGEIVGNAQIMKLINNVISVSNLAIAGEALLVGVKAGLDPSGMLSALNSGTGQSDASLTKIPDQVLSGKFAHGGAMHITKKDLAAFRDAASSMQMPVPLVQTVSELYIEAMEAGADNDDVTTVIRYMENLSGVKLRART